jgi:hypothetical protein
MVMVLQLMSRDDCEWVRVIEDRLKICEIKMVAGTGLIICSNSDT